MDSVIANNETPTLNSGEYQYSAIERLKFLNWFFRTLKCKEILFRASCEKFSALRSISMSMNASCLDRTHQTINMSWQLFISTIQELIFQRCIDGVILSRLNNDGFRPQNKNICNSLTDIGTISFEIVEVQTSVEQRFSRYIQAKTHHIDMTEAFNTHKRVKSAEIEKTGWKKLKKSADVTRVQQRKLIEKINRMRDLITNLIGPLIGNTSEFPILQDIKIIELIRKNREVVTETSLKAEAEFCVNQVS